VIFTPGDSNEGLLPTREIEAWREVFDRGTVARSGGGVRSLRQMELDYREPTWPHALSDDLVSRVIEDATQENSALPDSTISFTYRLAPYVVEIGDRYHARTPLRWELLTLDRHRGLASPRGFYDVDQALAASLAMVGHRQEAETLGVRAFARRQFERGSADVLTQRSALLLVRLYHLWDRDEEAFYRRWMPLF